MSHYDRRGRLCLPHGQGLHSWQSSRWSDAQRILPPRCFIIITLVLASPVPSANCTESETCFGNDQTQWAGFSFHSYWIRHPWSFWITSEFGSKSFLHKVSSLLWRASLQIISKAYLTPSSLTALSSQRSSNIRHSVSQSRCGAREVKTWVRVLPACAVTPDMERDKVRWW